MPSRENIDQGKRPLSIRSRLFGLARKAEGYLPLLALLSFVSTAVVIYQMYLLSRIIHEAFMLKQMPEPGMVLLLGASVVLRALLLWLRERFAQQKAVQIKSKLRLQVFDHLLELSPVSVRSRKTGELVNIVTDGTEKLDDYYTRYIPSIIHIAVLPPVIIVFTLFTDWLSGLILLLTAPLILFLMWLIGTWSKNLTRKQWSEMSAMSARLLDSLQGIKTLKIFNRNRDESARVAKVSDQFRIITMKVLKVAFLSGMVLELAASISVAMLALQVGIRLIEGMMGYQMGLFILLLAPEFYLPFRSLGQHHHTGMEGAAAAEKLFEISDLKVQPGLAPAKPSKLEHPIRIVFDEVDFFYPHAAHPALHRINCSIEPGKLTAVVGETGSGKTTFSYLLMRHLLPSSGQILMNGIPLSEIPEELLSQTVAYVPQHPHFFDMSVLENLLLANPDAAMDHVVEACKKTRIHDFVQSLPQNYHTLLTGNAARLSGGEKQRLAMARALLKNSSLLVMDEPTSNLDPESEELVALSMEELIGNRTVLIIAHRLKTVYRADKIMVFQHGHIAEMGSHQSLLTSGGLYAAYFRTVSEGGKL